MKRKYLFLRTILFLVILVFAMKQGYTQDNIAPFKTKPKTKLTATVSSDKFNFLYKGCYSPVSVCVPIDLSKVSISLSIGTFYEDSPGKYSIYIPDSVPNNMLEITVFAKIKGQHTKIATQYFRLVPIPSPVCAIGYGIRNRTASKAELTANPFLIAKTVDALGNNFDWGDMHWRITSYKVMFYSNAQEESPIVYQGNRFSDTLIEKIKSAPSGTFIFFTDIIIFTRAGEREQPAEDIWVQLKN